MNERMSELLRAIARPGLYFAVLLIVLPAVDFTTNVWPLRFGDVQWRFGAIGLLAGFTLTPLLGIFGALLAASLLELTAVQRVIAFLSVALAAILVLALPLFVLDWLQMRASAPPEAVGPMDVGSIKAMFKHLAVAASLIWFGVFAWRQAKREAAHRPRRHTTPIIRTDLGSVD